MSTLQSNKAFYSVAPMRLTSYLVRKRPSLGVDRVGRRHRRPSRPRRRRRERPHCVREGIDDVVEGVQGQRLVAQVAVLDHVRGDREVNDL